MSRQLLEISGPPPVLPKQAAQILHFESGSLWQLGPATVFVVKPVAVGKLLIRHLSDAHTEIVNAAVLRLVRGAADDPARQVPVDQHSSAVWIRAREEQRLIAPLIEQSTPHDRDRVAKALGLSDRQVRRKLRRFEALRSVEAFLPFRRGPLRGSTQLQAEVEQLVDEEIRTALKLSPDIGVDDLLPIITAATQALELRPPGRSTVSRRLRIARRNTALFPWQLRRELSDQRHPVRASIETGAPLSVVEIDHTVADVHLIEPRTGATIGRPVLTMMIDRATRVILGTLLSLEAPSQLSIGLCLHHGTFPKGEWLKGLGVSNACWPGFGLPSSILSDNGQEFHGKSFRRAAQVYGIELQYRPLGYPAAGGIIERAIGSFMTKVRLLPGSSFSKVLGKKPRLALRGGRMTLRELELYLARQVSVYHKTSHGTLEVPPALLGSGRGRLTMQWRRLACRRIATTFCSPFFRASGAPSRGKVLRFIAFDTGPLHLRLIFFRVQNRWSASTLEICRGFTLRPRLSTSSLIWWTARPCPSRCGSGEKYERNHSQAIILGIRSN